MKGIVAIVGVPVRMVFQSVHHSRVELLQLDLRQLQIFARFRSGNGARTSRAAPRW
jgi:hypothetical protein